MEPHYITLPGENGPGNLNPFQGQHSYSPNPFAGGGRMPFGVGSILMSLFGNRMWPIPQPGTSQGQFDAVWQRQHDMQMMHVARNSVSSWYPFQNMGGMNENSPITQIISSLMSQPDGLASTIMSPVLGGNPVQAQMASFANLQGIATAGLGNITGTSPSQLRGAADAFEQSFYNHDVKPINAARGRELHKAVLDNLNDANILGLSDTEKEAMFNPLRNYELIPGTTAFMKVNRANTAIQDLQQQIAEGKTPQQLKEFLAKEDLGDMVERFQAKTTAAFEDTKPEREKLFRDTIELAGTQNPETIKNIPNFKEVVDALSKLQSEGATKEQMLQKVEALKLDKSAGDMVKEAVKKGVEEGSTVFSNKVGENLQKESIGKTAQNMQAISNSMGFQKLIRGVNYDNTLGFNYEELLGARDEMLRSRLVGNKDKNLQDISALFGGAEGAYIPKLLDASRSAFGNDLTGKQLAQQLNKFIGYSNYDLNNASDASDLETNLRTLKATARVTGIDFNTMMNIEEQAQNMAALNPLTSHLGGKELGPIISDAALKTAAAGAGMSNEDVRYMGGSANMFRSRVEGAIESAQQPIATQLAAMHTYFKTNQGRPQNDKALDLISRYVETGDKTASGWTKFQEDIAITTGINAVDLQRYTQNNPAASRLGFQNAPKIAQVGGDAKVEGLLQGIELFYANRGGAYSGMNMRKEAEKLIETGQFGKLMTDSRFSLDGAYAPAWDEANQKGYLYDRAMKLNPNSVFAKNEKLAQESIAASVAFDKDISYRMGKMNAPTIQRIVQTIASGDVGSKGLGPLLEAVGISGDAEASDILLKNTDAIQRISGAGTVEDMIRIVGDATPTARVGKEDAKNIGEFSALATKFGISASAIDKIVESGGDITTIQKAISNSTLLDRAAGENTDERRGADADKIYRLAQKIQHSMGNGKVLAGYTGDFSNRNIMEHLKKPLFDRIVDAAGRTNEVRERFDKELIRRTTNLAESAKSVDGITDPIALAKKMEEAELAKTLQNLGSENAYKALEQVREDRGSGYEKDLNGQFRLSKGLQMFAQADGAALVYDDEKSAANQASRLHKLAELDKGITNLSYEKESFEKQQQKTKDDAAATTKMGEGITGILNYLPELTKALQAINKTLGTHN